MRLCIGFLKGEDLADHNFGWSLPAGDALAMGEAAIAPEEGSLPGAVLIVSIPLHLDLDVGDLEIKCELDGPAHARIEQLTITSSIALDRHTKNAEAVAR